MIANPNVKVNLGLDVLRKRPDGFHDIETLFVPYFGICDVLEIIRGDDFSRTSASLFARYGNELHIRGMAENAIVQGLSEDGKLMITIARKEGVDWNPLKDLTAKAYSALDADFNLPPVKIFLEKLSPVGAGLGGGSSDAAFALKMLNEMFSLGLDDTALAGYAARLGSDCAFFIYNRPMLGSGRGEILAPFDLPEPIDFGKSPSGTETGGAAKYELQVVISDNIYVSTVEAYKGIVPKIPEISLRDIISSPVSQWRAQLKNDFETTVFPAHPELEAIKQSLYDSGAVYAAMSGSGSALFGIYATDNTLL